MISVNKWALGPGGITRKHIAWLVKQSHRDLEMKVKKTKRHMEGAAGEAALATECYLS